MAPWASELTTVWQQATANLGGRKLVLDVKGLTCISGDGENVLRELMKQGAKFRCAGVFTKQILKRLAHEIHRNEEDKI